MRFLGIYKKFRPGFLWGNPGLEFGPESQLSEVSDRPPGLVCCHHNALQLSLHYPRRGPSPHDVCILAY